MLRPASQILKLVPSGILNSAKIQCQNIVSNPLISSRCMHLTSNSLAERRDLRTYRMRQPVKDQGTAGEGSIDIDNLNGQSVFQC